MSFLEPQLFKDAVTDAFPDFSMKKSTEVPGQFLFARG